MKKKRAAINDKIYSGLDAHKRLGSKLSSQLSELPVNLINWERDILPEYLWIGALAEKYTLEKAQVAFARLMDALDSAWRAAPRLPIGFLSDFALIPKPIRAEFKKSNEDLIRQAFQEPVGRMLAFYPQNPAAWLIDERFLAEGGSLDPDTELGTLRRLLRRLLPGRDNGVAFLRVLPITRLAKHGKLFFAYEDPLPDVLTRYPGQCSDDERRHVESFCRATAQVLMKDYAPFNWSQYFWRHNYDLAVCKRAVFPLKGSRAVTVEEGEKVTGALSRNASRARDYLDAVAQSVRPDLYNPERDEILFGLIARVVRLYVLMCEDPSLWARDVAGILLRCLTDTAINFAYLSRKGTREDFELFRKYGEGQQKLLMLHLQDTYPSLQSLEGRTSSDLGEELGSFLPELLDIELGSWLKKDSRKLAQESGLERFYRLVFTPASSDLHGTWFSLKYSNLSRCVEVLHRFHRLPAFAEPPMFLATAVTAQQLMEECIQIGKEALSYPAPTDELEVVLTGGSEAPDDGSC